MMIVFAASLLNIFLQINIHEFGHFIFGKILGYKLLSYRISFLSWDYENGKMKFSIRKNKGYSGLCAMIPGNNNSNKKYLLYFSGGLIFNIISVIVFLLIGYFIDKDTNPTAYIIIVICTVTTILLILMNGMPLTIGIQPNDGKLIFGMLFKQTYAVFLLELFGITAQLNGGVRPRDLVINEGIIDNAGHKSYSSINIAWMTYFRALDSKDYPNMKKNIDLLENNIKYIPNYMLPGIYYELMYYYSAVDFCREKVEYYYNLAKKILNRDMDVNGRRVTAAYEFYIKNDVVKAKAACEDGLRVADKFPLKGQVFMEKDLINELLGKDSGF